MFLRNFYATRPDFLQYLNAILLTIAALLLSVAFNALIGDSKFIFFFLAVTLSAWYAGLGPGLVSTMMSVMLVNYFLTEPRHTLDAHASDYIQMAAFSSVAILISWTENHRRQAENALRQKTDELNTILNGVSDAVTAQDVNGKVIYANEFAAIHSGYPSAHAMMHTPIEHLQQRYELFDLDGKPLPYHKLPRFHVVQSGQKSALTFRQRFLDTNEERWVLLTTSPIKDETGRVKMVVNVFRDVTQRYEIERIHTENLRFLRQMLDSLPILVGVLSPDGTLLQANKMALDLAGLVNEDVIGKPFDETYWWSYSTESQEHLRTMMARAAAGETVRYDVKIRISPEEYRTIDFMISAMQDSEGEISYLIPSAVDVTRRREREDEILTLSQRLKAEKRRLDTVIANIPGIVFEGFGSPEGGSQHIEFVSNYAEEMLGFSPQEWERNPHFFRDRIHPEDLEDVINSVTTIYKSRRSGRTQFRMIHKNGSIVYVESHASIMLDSSGNPMGACGVIMDITERKQSDQQMSRLNRIIEAQHERLANVIANVPGIVFDMTIDPVTHEHTAQFISGYTEKILGYDPTEWLTLSNFWCDVIIHPDDRQIWRQKVVSFARGVSAGSTQLRCIHKDGQIIHTEAQFVFISQADKWRCLGVLMDITERKRREEQIEQLTQKLRGQHRWLQGIIDNVPGIVYEVAGSPETDEQRVIYISDYAEKLLGYPMQDMLSVPNIFAEIMHPEDRKSAEEQTNRIFETQQSGAVHYRCITRDGRVIHLEAHGSIITNGDGQPAGSIGVVMDVTERKIIEQQLNQYMNDLHRSNQELEQFAYVASHDLQEPLRKIKSFLELLERRYGDRLDDDGREFISYAVDGAVRMRNLISDLLAYSRVQRNQGEFRSVDLTSILDTVLATLQLKIEDTNAIITHDPLPTVTANERQMTQLFQNLLSNALKYRREGTPPGFTSGWKVVRRSGVSGYMITESAFLPTSMNVFSSFFSVCIIVRTTQARGLVSQSANVWLKITMAG